MQDEQNLTPADREVEAALGRLAPAPSSIGRDALMFEAGRAAAGHSARRWQAISGVLVVALTVSLAGWSWVAGGPGPRSGGEGPVSSWAVVSDADAGRPEDHPPAVASRPHDLALRDRVLAEGVDALPTAKGRTTPVPDTWAEDLFPDMPPAWRPSIGAGQRERS